MISLWKTATDLERLDQLQRVAIDCYALAIAAAAQYPVEADRAEAAEFRDHVKALEKLLHGTATAESLQEVTASFRGELREYRERAHQHLERLRKEVVSAAAAMKIFADSVASHGADHERQLARELNHLETLAQVEDLGQVRHGIHAATHSISSSVDQMRRSNQLVIAQLRDEIRLLHQEIQTERRALLTDRASGAWNRQKLESRIIELLHQDEPFCVLLVGLRNFKALDGRHSSTVIAGALKAVLMRLHQMLGEDAMVGRWSEEEFAAILAMEPSQVMALSKQVTAKLSGDYAVQENGLSHNVTIHATAGMVDRRAGADPEGFRRKLEQMSAAVGG